MYPLSEYFGLGVLILRVETFGKGLQTPSREGKKELVLDAVSPDGNAVYAAFSKHIDLAFDDRPDMISRIAYDPEEHWHPGDLSFLQRAAPLINYRAAPEELMRLAA